MSAESQYEEFGRGTSSITFRPIQYGKSLVRRIATGELKLYGDKDSLLVAHDGDGVVVHEFPMRAEAVEWVGGLPQNFLTPMPLKTERDPSGEFPFPESKIRGVGSEIFKP